MLSSDKSISLMNVIGLRRIQRKWRLHATTSTILLLMVSDIIIHICIFIDARFCSPAVGVHKIYNVDKDGNQPKMFCSYCMT